MWSYVNAELIVKEFDLPIEPCTACNGYGNVNTFCGQDTAEYCPKCEGKGYVRKKISTRRNNRKTGTDSRSR